MGTSILKKLVICAAIVSTATMLQGAILYTASIGCQNACVTVSLSWAAESFPVYYAAVEDESDNVLFTLNLGPSAGQTTGSITPSPQTIGPLSANTIATIQGGDAYLSLSETQPGLLGGSENGTDGTDFTVQDVPEPEVSLAILAGLAAMMLRRRNAATGLTLREKCN